MVAPPDDRDGAKPAKPDAAEALKAEIRQDLAACPAYVAEHGSPAELLRRPLRLC